MQSRNSVSYFRNFVFGVEDSLVSTVGLLSGIAFAGVPGKTVFLTGIVLIFVEAFSMAAGSFLSEYSADEFAGSTNKRGNGRLISGLVMFLSYFFAGFIPLFPYLIWPVGMALKFSVLFSVASLFILGIVSAKISKVGILKSGLRMAVIGGIAIAVGSITGKILS